MIPRLWGRASEARSGPSRLSCCPVHVSPAVPLTLSLLSRSRFPSRPVSVFPVVPFVFSLLPRSRFPLRPVHAFPVVPFALPLVSRSRSPCWPYLPKDYLGDMRLTVAAAWPEPLRSPER